jgi:hypothetical protein
MTKKLVVGPQEWWIADATAPDVIARVKAVMSDRTSDSFQLYNAAGHAVTVYLNGATTSSVALDLIGGPRPSEMS